MKQYKNNYHCTSPKARKLWQIFSEECERNRILYKMPDIIHAYKKKYQITQLSLFD